MKYNVESYKAKPNALKIKVIEKDTTLKQVAKDIGMHYHALIPIGTGRHTTSKLRAQAIANQLDVKLEDLFVEVK
ncbi:hypothetical protein [Staphylococcus haemolyticus]|uniref:hypothetical protein n=1 Tax=Staphylococcus haemolyticus TaxID=1283 RepID=UPI0029022005|nr:hypothetical protein [Staphylococcus haemolyticus]MDU0485360.1 hypothetical protein [Staphylococcus haemolyticus]